MSNTTPTAKRSNTAKAPSAFKKTYLRHYILAIFLPFIGWGIGALLNPTGWLSRDIFLAAAAFIMIAIESWPITISIAIIIAFATEFNRRKNNFPQIVLGVMYAVSVVLSLSILIVTEAAYDQEFTD